MPSCSCPRGRVWHCKLCPFVLRNLDGRNSKRLRPHRKICYELEHDRKTLYRIERNQNYVKRFCIFSQKERKRVNFLTISLACDNLHGSIPHVVLLCWNLPTNTASFRQRHIFIYRIMDKQCKEEDCIKTRRGRNLHNCLYITDRLNFNIDKE